MTKGNKQKNYDTAAWNETEFADEVIQRSCFHNKKGHTEIEKILTNVGDK